MTLLNELESRLPPDCVQTDAEVVAAYGQDRAVFESAGTAAVLVMPRNTEQVVATLLAARAAGVPVVPRGAGTGLTGAANAIDGCVVLSLHRMNRILDVDVVNRTARVEPGVINVDLKNAVAEQGLFYPPGSGVVRDVEHRGQRCDQRRRAVLREVRGHPRLRGGPGGGHGVW